MIRTRHVLGFVGALVAALLPCPTFGQVSLEEAVQAGLIRAEGLGGRLAAKATPASGPTPTATPRPSPANLDSFMSYGTKPAKDATAFVPLGPVALPRLGGGPYDLLKVGRLLLPADKNGEGVRDAQTHLLEYRLKPSKGVAKFPGLAGVRVLNQCSDVLVALGKPVAALVPTAKSLAGPATAPADPLVDHFLCFEAKLQKKGPGGVPLPRFPKGVQVEVADQFQSRRYELTKPTRLCVPTDKNGTPLFLKGANKGTPAPLAPATAQHADEHLLCYKAKLAATQIAQNGCGPAAPGDKGTKIVPKQAKHVPRTGVFVANQLGALQLDTTKEVEVCVASFAELPGGMSPTLLPGDPEQLVSAATYDLSQSPPWTDAEISVAPSGARVRRTSLGIMFADDATVGAANALLARIRATIVAMLAGPPYVVVRIPDPGSLDALQAVIADVAADPAVASVSRDVIPEPAILPPDYPRPAENDDISQGPGLAFLDHLLQARVAQAWNARGAVKAAPAVVMADFFGTGVPGPGIDAEYPVSGDFAVGSPDPVLHGYQVLAVIAADFNAEGGPANCLTELPGAGSLRCATGIYPGPTLPRVRAVDSRRHSWLHMELKILEAVEAFNPALPVVNASIYNKDTVGQTNTTAKTDGARWIRLVRERKGGSLEANFLLVTAAGNVDTANNVRDALTNSSFTAAALHPDLPRLSNIIVVENALDTPFPFRPGYLNAFSKEGGHLSACGTNVWTLVLNGQNPSGGWDGTSFSSPVVAGVAAYAWSIAPELSVNQVKDLLIRNAQPAPSGAAPALDAYASIVDIDNVTDGGSNDEFPVRRALLDFISVGGEVFFNSDDVLNFFLFRYDRTPEARRYRKEDLRAAFAPQTDSVRFDLDASGTFEKFSVSTGSHRVQYDEESVNTDADIVCYSAFAPLGPYERSTDRVDPGRNRCCRHYKDVGRLPPNAVCIDECPARSRARGLALEEEEPQPLGAWRLSTASGLTIFDLFFLADGTVMILAQSGPWEKGGTWTSTPHEENGEVLYYDVTVDVCPDAIQHTRYGFVGTWSPRPLTDCFGVTSCFNGDACPAMQGLLTTSDGRGFSTTTPVDSKRVTGIDGWAPIDPYLNQCHGECFEEWWRSGLLACTPRGADHCIGTSAPTCGGVCPPGSACVDGGGSCTCVAEEP